MKVGRGQPRTIQNSYDYEVNLKLSVIRQTKGPVGLMSRVEESHVWELGQEKTKPFQFQFSLGLPLRVDIITTPKQVTWLHCGTREFLTLIRIKTLIRTIKNFQERLSVRESIEKDEVWMRVSRKEHKSTNLEFRTQPRSSSTTFSYSRNIHPVGLPWANHCG